MGLVRVKVGYLTWILLLKKSPIAYFQLNPRHVFTFPAFIHTGSRWCPDKPRTESELFTGDTSNWQSFIRSRKPLCFPNWYLWHTWTCYLVQEGVCCNNCSVWYHKPCEDLSSKSFLYLGRSSFIWHYCECNKTHVDSFTFNSFELHTSNIFYIIHPLNQLHHLISVHYCQEALRQSIFNRYKLSQTVHLSSARSNNIWATSWENLFMPYANNKCGDQPAHPRSLISAFVVRCLDSIIPLVSISEISSSYLVSVAKQAGLSLPWSETPETCFLVTRLNFHTVSTWTKNYEPPHDKINKMTVRPAKTQISLGIHPVWSESSLSAWRKHGSLAAHWAHSENSDYLFVLRLNVPVNNFSVMSGRSHRFLGN